MSAALRSGLGLARSLLMYRARPWRHAALTRFYRGIVRPGDLAFDLGAHAGNRTLALRAAGARVIALEPQGLFHAFLARTLPNDVVLMRAAAGAVEGTAQLAVSRLHPTVSSLAPGFAASMSRAAGFEHVRWDNLETVPVTTLDTLIDTNGLPRFVKIDVEGHEADVLAGLSHPVPWIAFEFLSAALDVATRAVAQLAAIGPYRFTYTLGERTSFAAPWTGSKALLDTLAKQAREDEGRSGDIYARLAPARIP